MGGDSDAPRNVLQETAATLRDDVCRGVGRNATDAGKDGKMKRTVYGWANVGITCRNVFCIDGDGLERRVSIAPPIRPKLFCGVRTNQVRVKITVETLPKKAKSHRIAKCKACGGRAGYRAKPGGFTNFTWWSVRCEKCGEESIPESSKPVAASAWNKAQKGGKA